MGLFINLFNYFFVITLLPKQVLNKDKSFSIDYYGGYSHASSIYYSSIRSRNRDC